MNTKTFFFWSGVAAVALVGAYVVIRWLRRQEQQAIAAAGRRAAKQLADAPRKEIGFHAIMQERTAAA